jgi:hypothetical protein
MGQVDTLEVSHISWVELPSTNSSWQKDRPNTFAWFGPSNSAHGAHLSVARPLKAGVADSNAHCASLCARRADGL